MIDAIHNFFFSLVKEHFHNIIGLKMNENVIIFIEFSGLSFDFTESEHKLLGKPQRVLTKAAK